MTAEKAKAVTVDTTKPQNYFNSSKTHPEPSLYDQTFHFNANYNQKLKREDMQHTQVMFLSVLCMF